MDQQRQAQRVLNLMGSLPELQRRALELAYFEGLTHSEVAQAMEQPLGTVKTWIRSALLRQRASTKASHPDSSSSPFNRS